MPRESRTEIYMKKTPEFAKIRGFLYIFKENISPAKPISRTVRCISWICMANPFHWVYWSTPKLFLYLSSRK